MFCTSNKNNSCGFAIYFYFLAFRNADGFKRKRGPTSRPVELDYSTSLCTFTADGIIRPSKVGSVGKRVANWNEAT